MSTTSLFVELLKFLFTYGNCPCAISPPEGLLYISGYTEEGEGLKLYLDASEYYTVIGMLFVVFKVAFLKLWDVPVILGSSYFHSGLIKLTPETNVNNHRVICKFEFSGI